MSRLLNKVAVITGASKGLGAEIAISMASEGASVVINYVSSQSGAQKVVDAILSAGGKAVAVRGDISRIEDAEAIIAAAVTSFGKIDILVNNSGVYEFSPLENITESHFHKLFNINVLGTLLVTQAALAHLNNGASVINIGSNVTTFFPAGGAVYTATKAALDAITGVLAKELGPRNIRVNSINPGLVETEGTISGGYIGSDFERQLVSLTPLGRLGQPGDIATVAVFLASDDAGWMTGEKLIVSGGMR